MISERMGMLKKYELASRHFGWKTKPKAATDDEILEYLLERSLRSQELVSLDSICYLDAKEEPGIRKLIEKKVNAGEMREVKIDGIEKIKHWIKTAALEQKPETASLTHILSPFDPLTIQRKRLELFFGYEHRFEAYLPKEKRKYGYFALPILMGNEFVAAIDLKTDRANRTLIVQKWNWLKKHRSSEKKRLIEEQLDRFERFQLQR